MNWPAAALLVIGIVLVIIGWRGSQANVWNMLTGHAPGAHTVGALVTTTAGQAASLPASTASAAPATQVVNGSIVNRLGASAPGFR